MEYKDYIKNCMAGEPAENSVEEAYKVYPAFMKRDTEEGKKEHYNAVHDSFQRIDSLFYQQHQETLLPKAGLYLMSLIDIMSVMSQEIFEHYKFYEGLFKKALKEVLFYYKEDSCVFAEKLDAPVDSENSLDAAGTFMIAYAVLKGCRMKAVLSEKYLDMGKAMYKAAAVITGWKEGEEMPQEMQLAYEEYQKAEK